MKHILTSIAFLLVVVPVEMSQTDHDYWTGAAFGLWGWLVASAVRWSPS